MLLIEIIKYILLGAIQGFTEPLPISSSAHMIILSHYLKIETTDLNFEIIIHFSSFLAIALFLRKDIISLSKGIISKERNAYSYCFSLILASIPAGIVGILFKDTIEKNFNNVISAGSFLLLTSLLLVLTSYFITRGKKKELKLLDYLTIGICQMFALLPGISRSGATLFGGSFRRGKVEDILRFSFFLYLIASLGALLLSLHDLDWSNFNFNAYLISFVSAFIATSIAIRWLYQIISKKSLLAFACYTFILGILILIFQ